MLCPDSTCDPSQREAVMDEGGNLVSYMHICGRRLVAKAGSQKKGNLSAAEAQVAKETGRGLGGSPSG